MKLRALEVVLVVLFLVGLTRFAFGQAFIGPMLQPGSVTVAGRPTPSASTVGGIIYDLDGGQLAYNDGTSWLPVSASSGVNYWVDGGMAPDASLGTIFTAVPIVSQDAGPSLYVLNRYASAPVINKSALVTNGIQMNTGNIGYTSILFEGGPGTVGGIIVGAPSGLTGSSIANGLNFIPGAFGTTANYAVSFKGGTGGMTFNARGTLCIGCGYSEQSGTAIPSDEVRLTVKGSGTAGGLDMQRWQLSSRQGGAVPIAAINSNGTFVSIVDAGISAYSVAVTGAVTDFGPGTNDYFTSDGTRIQCPGAVTVNTLRITGSGTGADITGSFRGTLANPGSCAANTTTDTAVTVTGAISGAECIVGVPAITLNTGLVLSCFVSATNTVQFRCANLTGGPITPTAGTYSVRVFNP